MTLNSLLKLKAVIANNKDSVATIKNSNKRYPRTSATVETVSYAAAVTPFRIIGL